jgi:hypothetical protein
MHNEKNCFSAFSLDIIATSPPFDPNLHLFKKCKVNIGGVMSGIGPSTPPFPRSFILWFGKIMGLAFFFCVRVVPLAFAGSVVANGVLQDFGDNFVD